MKKACQHIALSILMVVSFKANSQGSQTFDSLKVYYFSFMSTHSIKVDESYLTSFGDSLKFFDRAKISSLYNDLIHIKRDLGKDSIKNLRKDYSRNSIDIRLLFDFYRNGKKYSVGIAHTPLMFINEQVFIYNRTGLKKIKKFSSQLYSSANIVTK